MSKACGAVLSHTALHQQIFVLRDKNNDHTIKRAVYMELYTCAFKASALDAAEKLELY
jgi:hypothetical protein